jgi:hypothetical protein
MNKKTNNKTPLVSFNKLRKQLPHRYTVVVAERLENITPSQVKCVFRGDLKNPAIVKQVYAAATKLAEEHRLVKRLNRRHSTGKKA